jgi:CBS domain-containing protein
MARGSSATLETRAQAAAGELELRDAIGDESPHLGEERQLVEPVDEHQGPVVGFQLDELAAGLTVVIRAEQLGEGGQRGREDLSLALRVELDLHLAGMLQKAVAHSASMVTAAPAGIVVGTDQYSSEPGSEPNRMRFGLCGRMIEGKRSRGGAVKVEALMTRDVLTIPADMPLKQVAATLHARGLSGAPVCDAGGRVLGVVSSTDILHKERGFQYGQRGLLARLAGRPPATKLDARTAGEAMTAPAITAPPYMSAAGAARMMLEKGIRRLPVVSGDRLVGIVTDTDLVGAFDRPDEEIAAEIRDELAWQLPLPAEPGQPTVEVTNGHARVHGRVPLRSDVGIVEHVVSRVPGVVAVDAELSWQDDDRHVGAGAGL